MAPNWLRAVAQAGVAVDALGHLDAQRWVLPLRVALARRDPLHTGGAAPATPGCRHRRGLTRRVKGWWTGPVGDGRRPHGPRPRERPAHRPGPGAQAAARRRGEALFASRATTTPDRRHLRRGRRGQGPVLLVLREQGSAVRRAGALDAPAAAPGPGRGHGSRRRPGDPHPPGHRGVGALHGRARPASSRCSRWSATTSRRRRAAREQRGLRRRHGPAGEGGAGRRRHARRPRPAPAGPRRARRGRPLQPLPPQRAARDRSTSWPGSSASGRFRPSPPSPARPPADPARPPRRGLARSLVPRWSRPYDRWRLAAGGCAEQLGPGSSGVVPGPR